MYLPVGAADGVLGHAGRGATDARPVEVFAYTDPSDGTTRYATLTAVVTTYERNAGVSRVYTAGADITDPAAGSPHVRQVRVAPTYRRRSPIGTSGSASGRRRARTGSVQQVPRHRGASARAVFLVERPDASYDPRMSEAIAFDTHRFVERLTESGFTERQAETLAEEHAAMRSGNLAIRTDIAAFRADIAGVEARVKAAKSDPS